MVRGKTRLSTEDDGIIVEVWHSFNLEVKLSNGVIYYKEVWEDQWKTLIPVVNLEIGRNFQCPAGDYTIKCRREW